MNIKNTLFVSIVVPVYNVEKYLNQCVDSILCQTFADFELILIDDGSKDNSPIICDDYVKKDKRVTVVHQKNGGQVVARKAGLKLAKGEYIQFVDSDDWLEPMALQVACDSAKKHNADIVTFDSNFCYENRKLPVKQPIESGIFNKPDLIKKIYPKMIYSGRFFYFGIYAAMWNKVFRRSLLTPNMINVDSRLKIGEDGVTTFATFLDAKKICVLGGEYLYNYRDNNISITRSYCADQFDNAKLLIETLRAVNKIKNIYDLDKQISYYYMYNIYSIFIEEFYYRYEKSYFARFKYLKNIAKNSDIVKIAGLMKFDKKNDIFSIFFKLLNQNKINRLLCLSFYIAMKKRAVIFIKKLIGRY